MKPRKQQSSWPMRSPTPRSTAKPPQKVQSPDSNNSKTSEPPSLPPDPSEAFQAPGLGTLMNESPDGEADPAAH